MSKHVAKTLTSVLDRQIVKDICNRNFNIYESSYIDDVLGYWDYDLYSRKPGPAYKDEVFVGTDLDLAVFLYALIDRGAIINIPTYERIRGKSIKEGQLVVSGENRHGKILRLVSNKDTFIFSLKMMDANVITKSDVGDFRNYAMTDFDGTLYSGWETIQFPSDRQENQFLTEHKLLTGSNRIVFKNFVHPNRWTGLYGQYYFISKILIDRLKRELSYINLHIKEMKANGIFYKEDSVFYPPRPKSKDVGERKSIKVDAFHVEIDIPYNDSDWPLYDHNVENLELLSTMAKKYRSALENLRFMTRATECSYYKKWKERGEKDAFPSWIKDTTWQTGFKLPRKRIEWDRLILFQPKVGERGVAIRKRHFKKSERVDVKYKEK